MIILRYHEIFFRLIVPRCPGMAAGAVSLRKSHDIVILSFCNIVKGQAIYWISDSPNAPDHLGWIPIQIAAKKDMSKLLGFWLLYAKSQMVQME